MSTTPGDGAPRRGHYFDAAPGVGSAETTVDVVLPGATFVMATDRGVFSHGHLDTGTAILLRHPLELPSSGRFLDLGCGAGPIALTMAARSGGAEVWAVDVNERARGLCAANARRNHLGRIVVAAPDDVDPALRFDVIWSNPPIRIGKQELRTLLQHWLGRLAPGGVAVLVVQKHLGADSLHRWLAATGWDCERLTSKAGYRLLRVGPASDPRRIDVDRPGRP